MSKQTFIGLQQCQDGGLSARNSSRVTIELVTRSGFARSGHHILIFLIVLSICWARFAFADGITVRYQALPKSFFLHPDPNAGEWNAIETTTIPLLPQMITTPRLMAPTVTTLNVKAIHNNSWLAVLLEWSDATHSIHVETDHASDACAIQFPIGEAEKTSPFMGTKAAPVSILHWKGIWQQDVDDHYQRVTDLYPNTWVDTNRFGQETAVLARNPVSQTKRTIPIEELIAEGFGTLTTQSKQGAMGRGIWKDGLWHVVFARKLSTHDKQDAKLIAGATNSVAFAVWEGNHDNVGARKNYAPWTALTVEKKP